MKEKIMNNNELRHITEVEQGKEFIYYNRKYIVEGNDFGEGNKIEYVLAREVAFLMDDRWILVENSSIESFNPYCMVE